MRRSSDAGISEVISFVMILAMLIMAFTILTLYAVPAGGAQMEEIHNTHIQLQFSEFKSGIENAWISDNSAVGSDDTPGVTRESVFTLGPSVSDSGLEILSFPLTRAAGTLTVRAGTPAAEDDGKTYSYAEVSYAGSNAYVKDLDLMYWGWNNSLTVREEGRVLYVLPGSDRYKVVVRSDLKSQVSGSGRAVIEYRLVKVIPAQEGGVYYYVFDMGVR